MPKDADYAAIQIARWKLKKNGLSPFGLYKTELAGIVLESGAKILCNGVRNNNEIKCLRDLFTDSYVIGTDIAFASGNDVIQCDFSTLPVEWINFFDLCYSNALDHALDVVQTLREWRRVMKVGGWLVLRLSEAEPTLADPNAFDRNDIALIESCGFILAGPGLTKWPALQFLAT